jgi:hypothetical protein
MSSQECPQSTTRALGLSGLYNEANPAPAAIPAGVVMAKDTIRP